MTGRRRVSIRLVRAGIRGRANGCECAVRETLALYGSRRAGGSVWVRGGTDMI